MTPSSSTPKMGQEGAPIGEIRFEGVFVADGSILGGVEGMGFRSVVKVLNKQHINLSALSTGPASRMLNDAIAFAKQCRQYDKAISKFQLIQAM